MGCTPQKQTVYNVYEKVDHNDPSFLSGPFINSKVKSFSEIEEFYKNKTFIEEALKSLDANSNREFLGYRKELENGELDRKFTFLTYGQVRDMAYNLSRNMKALKLVSEDVFDDGHFKFMGIFSKNCPEWTITDIACQLDSVTSVTYYSTLGDIAFEHISRQTKVHSICLSTSAINVFIKYYNSLDLQYVKNVIVYDITQTVTEKNIEDLKNTKLNVYKFSDLLKKPEEKVELTISNPDTIVTLCYTSGTTALPKGAMLSQRNFVSNMTNIFDAGYEIGSNPTYLSYLPLAHVMERVLLLLWLKIGGRVCFAAGDLRTKLLENIELAQPTLMVAVPRVLDTFRKNIFDKLSKLEGCKKSMAEKAIRVKRENFRSSGEITHGWYDKLVFSKIRKAFGGRIQAFVTGSAPMTKDLAEDIKILFSVPIMEGYGMTECCAAFTVSHYRDFSNESVGGVIQALKLKLVDVPEMNYSSQTKLDGEASPTGEICMKGPSVFHGYFMNPEETKKAIDSEGWLHSGDVGRINPKDQGLKIIDRVKEIFKLSQGEYIAPSKLESMYSKSKFVTQIFVYGDSKHSFLIAIIVPNKVNLKTVANPSIQDGDEQALFNDKSVIDAIKKDFETIMKDNNLNGLERIQQFYLTSKEFTIDNGCLTPSLKLVRRKAADIFKQEIDNLYGNK